MSLSEPFDRFASYFDGGTWYKHENAFSFVKNLKGEGLTCIGKIPGKILMYCIYLQYTPSVRYYLHTLFWYRHTYIPPNVNFWDFWDTRKPEIQATNEDTWGVSTYDKNWESNNKYCIVIFPARIPVVWINLRIQLTAEMSKKKDLYY